MPFVKVTKKQKNDMLRSGGYRERDIVSKARFAVKGNKGRTVTFYKPHTRHGKHDYTKFETCMYDVKNKRWVGRFYELIRKRQKMGLFHLCKKL